jgi:hypothetical protein
VSSASGAPADVLSGASAAPLPRGLDAPACSGSDSANAPNDAAAPRLSDSVAGTVPPTSALRHAVGDRRDPRSGRGRSTPRD